MKSYLLELKSICKNFKFLAIILLLLCYQAMLFAQFQTESIIAEDRHIRANYMYSLTNNELVNYWGRRAEIIRVHGELLPPARYYSPERVEYDLKWYQFEKNLAENITESFESKDWSLYNRSMAERNLVEWTVHQLYRGERVQTPQQYFGADWDLYGALIEDPQFEMLPHFWVERITQGPEQSILTTAYYLHLLQEDLPPAAPHDTSPWGFTFNFLRRGMPRILGAIVLLLTVNLLHRDKKFGLIKSALQVPKSRSYYLFRKVSLGFISSLFVVLIPQLLMFLLQGVKHGFRGFNYPVLLDNGFLNWSVLSEHMTTLTFYPRFYGLGLSRYSLSSVHNVSTLDRIDFISLGQFLGLAFIFLAVFVLFCSVLGVLISTLVKNEIIAQIVAVGVFVLGNAFGNIIPQLSNTSWDLFSKANIIPLLEGHHLSTYLNSLAALCIAIILLFTISAIIFRKQDIISN